MPTSPTKPSRIPERDDSVQVSSRSPVESPVLPRRRSLTWLAGAGAAGLGWWPLWGCGGGGSGDSTGSSSSGDSAGSGGSGSGSNGSSGTTASCPAGTAPGETGGPYPGDGSNTNSGSTVDVLALAGVLRSDVRTNIGSSSVKTGTPLALTLTIVRGSDCSPVSGAAVYIWHCDKDGEYSAYTASNNGSHFGETYMRGVQLTDANGQVAFTTVYPGWYSGRMTHIHFEVYEGGNYATGTPTLNSQIAFPEAVTQAVYATTLYGNSQNTSVTFSTDNVFSDGTPYQMLSVADGGSPDNGYSGSLVVRLS